MRCVLVGNYGVGNTGDEALKNYFCTRFPEVHWSVLSARPVEGEFHRVPTGVRSLCSRCWMRTLKEVYYSDAVVFGGGSLFTDAESLWACWIWWVHAVVAWLFRKPIILAFQGIGPFRTSLGMWLAQWVVQRAVLLSVRDSASFQRVQLWKKNTECIHSFDPTFLLYENKKPEKRTKNVFFIIPRFSTAWSDEMCAKAMRECEELRSEGCELRVVSLHPDDQKEMELCRSIAGDQSEVLECRDMQELITSVHGATGLITQRYHGACASIIAGCPFVAVSPVRGDKLGALATEAACPSCSLPISIATIVQQTKWEELQDVIVQKREMMTQRAMQGENLLKEYFKKQK